MKKDVIKKVSEWLDNNGFKTEDSGQIRTIDTDGYTIYSDEELGASITIDNGDRYNFRIQSCEVGHNSGSTEIYSAGVRIFKLYKNENGAWKRDVENKIVISNTPTQNSLEELGRWFEKNTSFTSFPKFRSSDFEDGIKDFVYKVDNSKTLKVESEYDSIDDFFADKSSNAYTSNASILIFTVDKKIPIMKLEKELVGKSKRYRFIVEIKTEKGDEFIIRSIIDTKEKFYNLLNATINSLREFKEFNKYVADLSKCL